MKRRMKQRMKQRMQKSKKSKSKNKNKKDKSKNKDKTKKENKKSEGDQLISSDENQQNIKIKPYEDSSNNATKISNQKNNEVKNEEIIYLKDNSKQTDEKKENDDKKDANKKDNDKNSDKNKDQLFDYDDDELNELSLEKVLKYDNRSFCRYYGSILLFSHIILNVFFRHNDYNLFTVKLGLLFMTFPINLTMKE